MLWSAGVGDGCSNNDLMQFAAILAVLVHIVSICRAFLLWKRAFHHGGIGYVPFDPSGSQAPPPSSEIQESRSRGDGFGH